MVDQNSQNFKSQQNYVRNVIKKNEQYLGKALKQNLKVFIGDYSEFIRHQLNIDVDDFLTDYLENKG